MPPKKPKNQDYSPENIEFLTPREHIRRRPGMYVGGTDKRAFHHLLWEVVDDSIIEAMSDNSPCDQITISLLSNSQVRISDNGVGIPTQAHKIGRSHLELYMTELYSRKSIVEGNYRLHGGLHGVDISAVVALSSEIIAESKRDGYLWRQTYSEGIPTSDVEQIRPLTENESTGTSITFTPDFTIMDEGLTFDYELILERCRELAYLLPQVTFRIEKDDQTTELHQAKGIMDWVADLNQGVKTLHPILHKHIVADYEFPQKSWTAKIEVQLAVQFREDVENEILPFVNTIRTVVEGTHIDGLYTGLSQSIYGDNLHNSQSSFRGLVAVLYVLHQDPHFESQTKIKLLNPDVENIVSDCVQLMFSENPDALAILQNHFQD